MSTIYLNMKKNNRKYFFVFLITLGIFSSVFLLVNQLDKNRIAHVDDLQRKITVDLIATETQFDLLKTVPCDLFHGGIISEELSELGQKLSLIHI